MPVRLDIAGERFGRLVVMRPAETVNAKTSWLCRCDCGAELPVVTGRLRSGNTQSCGCRKREMSRDMCARLAKHGMSRTATYRSWAAIIDRCTNLRHSSWADYGGRGIAMCDRWRESFDNFLADMGERPSKAHSIDRIDNDRGYEPGNCRWATTHQQNQNRRFTALDPVSAVLIRQLAMRGMSRRDLALGFGVSKSAVGAVVTRKSWPAPLDSLMAAE